MAGEIASVLVVDDEPSICELVQGTLGLYAGWRVRSAHTLQRAIEALEEPPDLVLLDCVVGGEHGRDLLPLIRSRPELRAIPVIFLTGLVHDEDLRALWQSDAAGVLVKPFRPSELVPDIRRLLSQRGSVALVSGAEAHP
ncbi:MAG: response regulator [Myxococcales bacterium]